VAVTYNTALTNTRLTDVINAIDAGAGAGYMEVGTTGMAAVLSTIVLAKPCGTVAARVLTFSTMPRVDVAASVAGVAAAAQIKTSAGTLVVSGLTVGLAGSGSDAIINSVNISIGDIVTLTSATITG